MCAYDGFFVCSCSTGGLLLLSQHGFRSEHLPGQIHSFQNACVVDDAILQNAISDLNIVKDDAIGELTFFHRTATPQDNTPFANAFGDHCSWIQDRVPPYKESMGVEICFE